MIIYLIIYLDELHMLQFIAKASKKSVVFFKQYNDYRLLTAIKELRV